MKDKEFNIGDRRHIDNDGNVIMTTNGNWRGFSLEQIVTINDEYFIVVAVFMESIKLAEVGVGYINYDNMFNVDVDFLKKNKVRRVR